MSTVKKVLSEIGSDAKTIKSNDSLSDYVSGIVYLAPADNVSGINLCPMSEEAGCREACLYSAGLASVYPTVKASRIRKSELFRDDRKAFMAILVKDIARELRKADRKGLRLAIRLNGTSDILFERIAVTVDDKRYKSIFEAFDRVTFYDYSKNVSAARIRKIAAIPNYSVTASYSEASIKYAKKIAWQSALNIAVVFR